MQTLYNVINSRNTSLFFIFFSHSGDFSPNAGTVALQAGIAICWQPALPGAAEMPCSAPAPGGAVPAAGTSKWQGQGPVCHRGCGDTAWAARGHPECARSQSEDSFKQAAQSVSAVLGFSGSPRVRIGVTQQHSLCVPVRVIRVRIHSHKQHSLCVHTCPEEWFRSSRFGLFRMPSPWVCTELQGSAGWASCFPASRNLLRLSQEGTAAPVWCSLVQHCSSHTFSLRTRWLQSSSS